VSARQLLLKAEMLHFPAGAIIVDRSSVPIRAQGDTWFRETEETAFIPSREDSWVNGELCAATDSLPRQPAGRR
jgi:hypothetical protein